jgi:hypothetical protein
VVVGRTSAGSVGLETGQISDKLDLPKTDNILQYNDNCR